MFFFKASHDYNALINEYGYKSHYKVFLLTERPPEIIPSEPPKISSKPQGVHLFQRPDWKFSQGESQKDFRERKRMQWANYANSLVIILNDNKITPVSIFKVDSYGNANIVTLGVDLSSSIISLREDFIDNVLPRFIETPKNLDGSFLLSQQDFIKYITQFTGYHPQYSGNMKKGLTPEEIVHALKQPIRVICTNFLTSNNTGQAPSPISITERMSPTRNQRPNSTTYNINLLEGSTPPKLTKQDKYDYDEEFDFTLTFK